MAFVKGQPKPPRAGRAKAGILSKAALQREAHFDAEGLTPLKYLLEVMRNPDETPSRRMAAAVAAAPYVHPRQPQVLDHSFSEGIPTLVVRREL